MQSPGNLSRREGIAWLAVLPLLLYLLLTGAGASNGTYLVPFRIVSLAILVGVFAGWAWAAWLHPAARPRSVLAPVIVLIVAAQTVAAVLSPLPRIGLEYAGYTGILAGLYLLLVRLLARPSLARRIALVVAVVTLVIAGLYLAVVVGIWLDWWAILGRLTVPPLRPEYQALMYGAPGILTAFLVCAAVASISMLWPSGSFRALCVALAAVVLIAVVVASARSAWAGVAAAAVIGAVVILLTGRRLAIPRAPRTLAMGAIAGLGVLLVALAIGPALIRRFTLGGGEEFRVSLAGNAMRLFSEHPLTGGGPGQWVISRTSLTAPSEIDWYIPHAHNVATQTLAESGVLGAIVGIVAILAVGHVVIRAFRSGDVTRRSLAIGVVVIATYFAVHQLFDFFLDMPAIMFAAVLPLAGLDAMDLAASGQEQRPPSRRLVAVPTVLAIVPLLLLLAVERPALLGEAAAEVLPGDPAQAVALATEAIDADGEPTPYRWTRGLAEASLGNDAAALADLDGGCHAGRPPPGVAGCRVPPGEAWATTMPLESSSNGPSGSDTSSQRSTSRRSRSSWHSATGQRAEEQAVLALPGAPTLTDDPWWQSSPELQSLHDAAVVRVVEGPDLGGPGRSRCCRATRIGPGRSPST